MLDNNFRRLQFLKKVIISQQQMIDYRMRLYSKEKALLFNLLNSNAYFFLLKSEKLIYRFFFEMLG